ncbi:MAG: Periplasmic pH-dependent serine endoprotease DegQ [Verrucomicrobia subdivision 3 bacterium]|nr:Periplasmic pH-dependent serine endoprotease DegQ [Limisphaerales bacterium]MCS1415750.1 Periplasmic pH-dependent serine endoprotease DegQ [Limisphaerales bacterium]
MKKIIRNIRTTGHLTLLSLLSALIGSGAMLGWFTYANGGANHPLVNLVIDDTPIQRTGQVPASFSDVVKEVSPSVVRINTTSKTVSREIRTTPFGWPWWFFDDLPVPPRFEGPIRKGLGSGVIISEDGYILTNNHLVDGVDRIKVILSTNEREYQAELVGTDPKSDLAVLKIGATALPYIRIGDSDQIEVGDIVLAVGNPFGVGQTVTMGIVGATGRASMGLDYEDFIQTDAAINPGNSGGALVDIEGRLVGINTAILSKTGANQGIGFAIPTNLARNVIEDLIEKGRVVRGFLGVGIQDINPQLAEYFDIENSEGALVADVAPNGPAERAGLRVGDVITKFNDTRIKDSRQLKLLIGESDPQTNHDLLVLRNNKLKSIMVSLDELADDQPVLSRNSFVPESEGGLDGVTVSDLDFYTRQRLRAPRSLRGALVTKVDRQSPSWRAGLRLGDVIREINGTRISDADAAIAKSETLDGDIILLWIWRNGSSFFMTVDESELG